MIGVVLRVHDEPISGAVKDALRLIDAEPVLDAELIALGKWISGYYCAPLGEVLRSMLPLASDVRAGTIYSLTDAGRDASRQMSIDPAADDAVNNVIQMLAAHGRFRRSVEEEDSAGGPDAESLEKARVDCGGGCRRTAIRCAPYREAADWRIAG